MTSACYHCAEPVPPGVSWSVTVDGAERALCCAGCEAAARAILDFGLGDYYRVRERPAQRPDTPEEAGALAGVYDDPALGARYVERDGDTCRTSLIVGGMTCSACAWLLEQRLAAEPGVLGFEIDYATRRAEARWDGRRLGLGGLCSLASALGLELRPFSVDARRALDAAEARGLLGRFGVAAVFGMQVMMIALALYLGAAGDDDAALVMFLRVASLVLTLPVLLYSAQPFFRAAWRGLRGRAPGMDLPVSLAILAAFTGSAWHTVRGSGEIYFDSVVMFTTFLLLSRWLELRARVAAANRLEALATVVPDAACRVFEEDGREHLETVPAMRLVAGDLVLVRGGETVPADGVVEGGTSTLDEAILTGEALPVARGRGARVLAGSVNLESPLRIRVTGIGATSFAGHLAALVQRAAAARPAADDVVARVARRFVGAVLLVAVLTAAWWLWRAPERALAATLAVLVVSCPCALAIARPAALAAAHATLLGAGIAVVGAGALERLAGVTRMVFDKTGTLSSGHLALHHVETFGGADTAQVSSLAAALAEASQHPLARALRAAGAPHASAALVDVAAVAGAGAYGDSAAGEIVLGSARFITERCGAKAFDGIHVHDDAGGKEAWLAVAGRIIARLEFSDPLRAEAPSLLAALRADGLRCAILSGDREAVVAAVAGACGDVEYHAAQRPDDKLARVRAWQAAGDVVAMTGDGINDSAVMAGADVSLAVADATAPARQQADILLLRPDLGGVHVTLQVARRLVRVIRQNLGWAVAYNVLAMPLAVSGALAPWAAALGMSASSLLVVLNALRVRVPGA